MQKMKSHKLSEVKHKHFLMGFYIGLNRIKYKYVLGTTITIIDD